MNKAFCVESKGKKDTSFLSFRTWCDWHCRPMHSNTCHNQISSWKWSSLIHPHYITFRAWSLTGRSFERRHARAMPVICGKGEWDVVRMSVWHSTRLQKTCNTSTRMAGAWSVDNNISYFSRLLTQSRCNCDKEEAIDMWLWLVTCDESESLHTCSRTPLSSSRSELSSAFI